MTTTFSPEAEPHTPEKHPVSIGFNVEMLALQSLMHALENLDETKEK